MMENQCINVRNCAYYLHREGVSPTILKDPINDL